MITGTFDLEVGFYLGYAELTQEKGEPRHYNTSILVDTDGRIIGRYREIHLPVAYKGKKSHFPSPGEWGRAIERDDMHERRAAPLVAGARRSGVVHFPSGPPSSPHYAR